MPVLKVLVLKEKITRETAEVRVALTQEQHDQIKESTTYLDEIVRQAATYLAVEPTAWKPERGEERRTPLMHTVEVEVDINER